MKPKVSFSVRDNTLQIKINVHGQDKSVYSTGIACSPDKFDAKKQLCGQPSVQSYMDAAISSIQAIYRPGLLPVDLWKSFVESQKPKEENHTVAAAFEYYFRTTKMKEATRKAKQTVLNQLIAQGLQNVKISELNGAAIRAFVSSLMLSDSSSHATYVRLKTVLEYYIEDNGLNISIPQNLFKSSRFEADEDAYLTWQELKALLSKDVESEQDRFWVHFFALMALTGMSVSDALKFEPDKHVKGDWIKYRRQKTNSSCLVPFFELTRAQIESMDKHLNQKWPVKFSVRTVQNRCDGIISTLVGRKIKSHGGRKSFGAICLEVGYSIESIAKFMGHANPMITAQIYAKVTEAKIEREMRDMPESAKQMMRL